MPTYSSITITFNNDLEIDQGFGFNATGSYNNIGNPTPFLIYDTIKYRAVSVRYGSGQVAIGPPTSIAGERSAINFVSAFTADFISGSSIYSISRVDNVVTIYSNNDTITFINAYSWDHYSNLPNVDNNDVTFSINNYNGSFYVLEEVDLIESVINPNCTHYAAQFTTSLLTDNYVVSGSAPITDNTDNPFIVEIPRGQGYNITCFSETDQSLSHSLIALNAPPILSSAAIEVQINNSPLGATVLLNYNSMTTLDLEYSLDGTNWQSSNAFSGILDGDYVAYIKNLGCVVSLDFTVNNETNIVRPYFYISKANSFRFAERVIETNCSNYRTEENTLSNEFYAKDQSLSYLEKYPFQSCDVITTQFKSNYANISANVIKEDGSTDPLIINQLTNNIGIKDSRNAFKYNIGDGLTGIYYISGSTFDYDTGADLLSPYLLNGSLPEYGKIGNWVLVDGAYYQIINIIFDENINADILVIDETYLGEPVEVLVKCIYNRQKYEVYEFITDLLNYNNQLITIEILNEDDSFENKRHVSEIIDVKDKHHGTLYIEYYGKSNTDIFYATGIKNKIRVPLINIEIGHQDDSEILMGDETSNLIESSVYETTTFTIGLVTHGNYRRIVQALSHKYLSIDGVGFIKNGEIEIDGPLDSSNLFLIKAKMLKTASPFNSNLTGVDPDISFSPEAIEVPNIVISDNGEFISYD